MNLNILLRSADGFLQTGKTLYTAQKNTISFLAYYISPYAVNCAFACELYLKYLYAVEHSGEVRRGHLLNELFALLSQELKSQITAEYAKWTSLLPIDECLKVHNRVFEDFRYLHEEQKKAEIKRGVEPQSLYNLMISLHNVCKAKEMEESENAH